MDDLVLKVLFCGGHKMGVVTERTDQDSVLWAEDSSKPNGTWNRYQKIKITGLNYNFNER